MHAPIVRAPVVRALILALAFACLALIASCTAAPPSTQSPQPADAASSAPVPATVAPVATPAPVAIPAAKPATGIEPAPIEHGPLISTPLAEPNRSCKTDADCTIKDVGNCCGYYPSCMNKDAKTDPAAVRAQCEKEGMASVCGFPDISGCQCVKGQCENLTNGAAVM